MKIFIIAISLLFIWTIWGYFSSRVEQANYKVVAQKEGYELREYPEHIVAQTTIQGDQESALNKGFTIIAGYIFGGNTKKQSIAMTAPVTEKQAKASSEKIAMTAPVLETAQGENHVIAFVMPAAYTMDTLPEPNDKRVELKVIERKKFAVLRFSWYYSASRIQALKEKLLTMVKRDGVEIASEEMSFAGYNAPWTPPWMVKNEVLIEVK